VKLAAFLTAALMVVGSAVAQQPRGGQRGGQGGAGGGAFGGGFGGGLASAISRNKELQDELKVDADQLEKLTAALTKAREDSRDLTQKLFNRDTPMEERTEVTKKIQEINEKAVASALKPEQVKRLHQIEHQAAGVGVFNRPDVIEALKLTDEQKEKVAAINRELANDRRELLGAGGGGGRPGAGGAGGAGGGFGRRDPETTKKLDALTKEAMANAVKVLNDEQQKTYKELVGEPTQIPLGTLAFGGGFGGPGGGAGGFGAGGGFGGFALTPPGTVLAPTAQTQLKLTDEQKKELEAIQKEVDARLEKLLTDEQKKQLKDLKDRAQNPFAGFGAGATGGRGNRQPKKDD